jgi:hypothetical protein
MNDFDLSDLSDFDLSRLEQTSTENLKNNIRQVLSVPSRSLYNAWPVHPFWEAEKFKRVEEIFPNWRCARPLLTDYLKKCGRRLVAVGAGTGIDIGFNQPTVMDEITRKMVLMWKTFPPEDQELFLQLLQATMTCYIPELPISGEKLTDSLVYETNNKLIELETQIIACGGRCFHHELVFRLGISLWSLF